MKIRKGTHSPWRLPVFLRGGTPLFYQVIFDNTCRYHLPHGDTMDINKLIGIGYMPWHRVNSVRIGWRWIESIQLIELLQYIYINGKRTHGHLAFVPLNEKAVVKIWGEVSCHKIQVDNKPPVKVLIKPRQWGYLLRPYFGGNQPAPHTMTIYLKNL